MTKPENDKPGQVSDSDFQDQDVPAKLDTWKE